MKDFPLTAALGPLERSLRRHDALQCTVWATAVGSGIALILAVAARIIPLWTRAELLVRLSALLLCPLWGALWGALRPHTIESRLRRIERATGLAERLSTAWELHVGLITAPEALRLAQQEETLHRLHTLDARQTFPLRLPFSAWVIPGALLLGLLTALLFPNPQERVLSERAALQATAAAEAERLAAQIETVHTLPSLIEAEREAVLQSLEAARRVLLDPAASNAARQSALLEAEQRLAALQTSREDVAPGLQEALNVAAIQALASERTQALVEALQRGDWAAAETQARQLAAADPLTAEEIESLSAALQQLADAAQTVDPAFTASLESAAAALGAGETAAGLETLATTVGQTQETAAAEKQARAATQEELTALQASLQSGRERLAAAQRAAEGSTISQQGPGVARHSEDSGSSAPYGAWGGERLPESGSEITLPRAVVSGDTPVAGPGAVNPARVPYYEVYPMYSEAAVEALSRQPLPPGLRASIRTYFSTLAPENAPAGVTPQ